MYISYKEKNITEEERKNQNEKYIKSKLIEEKEYFDNMFKKIDKNIKLDENQRRIILTDEKYTMVIAGAGSGKTTTISAKVNYLIEKRKIKDDEIIIISFTNQAVQELKNRINIDFKHNIEITTFHKLGYQIIKDNNKDYPKINKDDLILKKCIKDELLNKELNKNQKKDNKLLKKIKMIIKNKLKKNKHDIGQKQINTIAQYISLYKSKIHHYKENGVKKQSRHIKIASKIYNRYNEELKKHNLIDFDDIINEANKIVDTSNKLKFKYKYIIIDEYQDISENRYNLIKNISTKINTKIMVVGDDWQCIYSFAASNINLFTNFKKNVEYCEILKIEKTYRNSQQLIDIAGQFIQKNSNQIKKQLTSDKQLERPITIIEYKVKEKNNQNEREQKKAIKKALNYIIEKYGKEKNILILGRYKFDKNNILDEEIIEKEPNKIVYKKYPEIKIEYLTIHSSKGLGYDNVILINAKKTALGFPSKIKTNKILKHLIIEDKGIKYSEERRLFYVALTRTKNEILILTPKHNYSEFIKEIKNKCNKM